MYRVNPDVCAINVKTTLAVVFAFIGYTFDENLLFDQNAWSVLTQRAALPAGRGTGCTVFDNAKQTVTSIYRNTHWRPTLSFSNHQVTYCQL